MTWQINDFKSGLQLIFCQMMTISTLIPPFLLSLPTSQNSLCTPAPKSALRMNDFNKGITIDQLDWTTMSLAYTRTQNGFNSLSFKRLESGRGDEFTGNNNEYWKNYKGRIIDKVSCEFRFGVWLELRQTRKGNKNIPDRSISRRPVNSEHLLCNRYPTKYFTCLILSNVTTL